MNEIELIEKIQAGNTYAYKKLYDLYSVKLYRFLTQFSHDDFYLQEWVQRAFIKAYNNINKFEGTSKFSTWLFKIAMNEMRSDFSKTSYKNTDLIDDDCTIVNKSSLEVEFEWQHDMKWLLKDLDYIKKAIFILYEVEGYNHIEISEILNISEVSSRTNLCRVKKLLQIKWNKSEEKICPK